MSESTGVQKGSVTVTLPRLLVYDTSVLMHDWRALFSCGTDDILITRVVLLELDNNKSGFNESNRNARTTSRHIDVLSMKMGQSFEDGAPLSLIEGQKQAKGRLYIQSKRVADELREELSALENNDYRIIAIAKYYNAHKDGRWSEVLVISNDVNFRIAARGEGLYAEQYVSDHHSEDDEVIASNVHEQKADFWEKLPELNSFKKGPDTFYTFPKLIRGWNRNDFVRIDGDVPLNLTVVEKGNRSMVLRVLRDYASPRNAVWGINARNDAQNYALNLLMDPSIENVQLIGVAGCGKTLLALAAAITQVFELKRYSEIFMTRATIPVGEEIGFLPGNEKEKMEPWMGALMDNLEVLTQSSDEAGGSWGKTTAQDLLKSRIQIKSMGFMRGRTLLNKFIILDETQNLNPKQMKTMLTRVGPGSKIVCLGNNAQIDTPYLTEWNTGLTVATNAFRGLERSGFVILRRGERSWVANMANDVL